MPSSSFVNVWVEGLVEVEVLLRLRLVLVLVLVEVEVQETNSLFKLFLWVVGWVGGWGLKIELMLSQL